MEDDWRVNTALNFFNVVGRKGVWQGGVPCMKGKKHAHHYHANIHLLPCFVTF